GPARLCGAGPGTGRCLPGDRVYERSGALHTGRAGDAGAGVDPGIDRLPQAANPLARGGKGTLQEGADHGTESPLRSSPGNSDAGTVAGKRLTPLVRAALGSTNS